jgi:biopolymer transport protein TolR
MGMSLGKKGGKTATPNVNVTPLVDVALVILIIFMVVTPLMTKTFWLNLPKQEEKDKPPPPPSKIPPLVMTVDKQGAVHVNKVLLKRADIAQRLPRMLAAQSGKVLYFDAHDELPYGEAVKVMDLARAGGARSIAMLTKSVVK